MSAIIEILIHEEPDCQQPVQLRPDLGQETALLARHEDTDRPNHPELQRCGKPPRRLFIQNEQRGSRLQTQTDDLTFSWPMEALTVPGWSGCPSSWTRTQSGSLATVGSTSLTTAGGTQMQV